MALREDPSDEDMFTESYLDAFYKAHVAARNGRGNLDDDIAAIEAEIRKYVWRCFGCVVGARKGVCVFVRVSVRVCTPLCMCVFVALENALR